MSSTRIIEGGTTRGPRYLLFWIPIGKPSGKCKIIHGVLLLCIASAATISPTVWLLHGCATTVVISFSTRQVNYPTICVYYPNTRQTGDRDDCFLFESLAPRPEPRLFRRVPNLRSPVFVRGITRSWKGDVSLDRCDNAISRSLYIYNESVIFLLISLNISHSELFY